VDRERADEDSTMGICLRGIGINPLNTLDENLRNRFLTERDFDHESSLWRNDSRDPQNQNYFWKYRPKFMGDSSTGCCSEHLISAHTFGLNEQEYENEFLRLNRTYNTPKNWDELSLPPRPR